MVIFFSFSKRNKKYKQPDKYTEKFSIGTEYKSSMYQMLQDIMMVNKKEIIQFN